MIDRIRLKQLIERLEFTVPRLLESHSASELYLTVAVIEARRALAEENDNGVCISAMVCSHLERLGGDMAGPKTRTKIIDSRDRILQRIADEVPIDGTPLKLG